MGLGWWAGREAFKRKVHISGCVHFSHFKPNQDGGQLSARENRGRNRANQAVK